MANIEKHPKPTIEQIDRADFSVVPTRVRASYLICRYIKGRQKHGGDHLQSPEDHRQPVVLRIEDLPATQRNLERIRERVRLLNRRLAASGAPFRLRVGS